MPSHLILKPTDRTRNLPFNDTEIIYCRTPNKPDDGPFTQKFVQSWRSERSNSVSRGLLCKSADDARWKDPTTVRSGDVDVYDSSCTIMRALYRDLIELKTPIYDEDSGKTTELVLGIYRTPQQCHKPHADIVMRVEGQDPQIDADGKVTPIPLKGAPNRKTYLGEFRRLIANCFTVVE